MSQLIQFKKPEEALPNLFNYYLYRKKIGIFVCLTGGMGEKTGAAKSYTGIRLCSITDPKRFHIGPTLESRENDCHFNGRQLMQGYDDVEASGEVGRAKMLDEAGIAIAARKWQQLDNETLGENFQTGRYLRTFTVIITPFFSLIDKNVRKLINFWGTTELITDGWDLKARLHLYRMKTDILGEKAYPKRLVFWDAVNKRRVRAKWFDVGLVGPEYSEPYERLGREFKNTLRNRNLKRTISAEKSAGMQVVDSNSLPEIADRMLSMPKTKDLLLKAGKVDQADVLLMNRHISPTYASLVSQMMNKVAEERGLISRPVEGRKIDGEVKPIVAAKI